MSDTNPVPDHVQRMDGRAAAGAARIMQLAAESANPVPAPTPADLAYYLPRELFDLTRRLTCHPDLMPDRIVACAAIRRALHAEAECKRLRALVDSLAARVAAQSELLGKRAKRRDM